jgi:hypothetical protein
MRAEVTYIFNYFLRPIRSQLASLLLLLLFGFVRKSNIIGNVKTSASSHAKPNSIEIERSLDYLRNIKPLPSHSSLFCISPTKLSFLHNADHEPTMMMMKFLMGEHRSHRSLLRGLKRFSDSSLLCFMLAFLLFLLQFARSDV